ncbi:MAG: Mitochondrial outer membrane protein iml2 [Bogoriella megaspora]|nr:MAG: Mitochondrial outer membrane protein iml2 [Bogoriella megaspora]
MRRVFGGLRPHSGSSSSLDQAEEPSQLEDAMRAVSHIMNDDVDTAETELGHGSSPFHKLGSGVVSFLRATLGFEQDMMREASERLYDAESAASDHQRRAQKDPKAFKSSIYPPGSEFALCHAESQLMSAVVGVLNESLTESVKGFYKLRKAYTTLDGIMQAEQNYLKQKSVSSVATTSTLSNGSVIATQKLGVPGGFDGTSAGSQPGTPTLAVPSSIRSGAASPLNESEASSATGASDEEDDEDEFVDAEEDIGLKEPPKEYQGHLEVPSLNSKMNGLDIHGSDATIEGDLHSTVATPAHPEFSLSRSDFPDMNPIDDFIHAGSNLCFGLLLLILSMIPPAFGKLLYIIGFKGDRERGIKLLWEATHADNINGGLAGLILLGFLHGLTGFCDITPPDDTEGGYPRERCKALLSEMRARYPKSHLWLLEDSRMLSSERYLEEAVALTTAESPSPLKQVEALRWFENSLNTMYLHRYQDCSDSFQKCITLNNWSHALYCYNAGACHIELYRKFKDSDPKEAEKHAQEAERLLKKAPTYSGKKKFMARQLPFDVFVSRKVAKWEHRAAERNIPFVDAVGVSPVAEMTYFWNGMKRQRPEQLKQSLENIAWSADVEKNTGWESEALDEKCVEALLRAAMLRALGDTEKAKGVLKEVLAHDREALKGNLKDTWVQPVAAYEMAVCIWMERDGGEGDKERVRECGEWLDKVAGWETYEMEARIGMRVTAAKDTLKKYGAKA